MTDLFETKSKPVPVTKDMVREAYRKVRSNKGSAGVDQVSLQEFEGNLSKNLYKLRKDLFTNKGMAHHKEVLSVPC